jgi:hypothetical protein
MPLSHCSLAGRVNKTALYDGGGLRFVLHGEGCTAGSSRSTVTIILMCRHGKDLGQPEMFSRVTIVSCYCHDALPKCCNSPLSFPSESLPLDIPHLNFAVSVAQESLCFDTHSHGSLRCSYSDTLSCNIRMSRMVSFIPHSFLYVGVKDLVCWTDLWHRLPPPLVLQFHSACFITGLLCSWGK